MAGLLSGLAGLGLDKLENMNIYEEAEKAEDKDSAKVVKVEEKDFIYEKVLECPVCGQKFPNKIMKTGKNKLIGTDQDLRPRYEGIDAVKYDVVLCTKCGYAALTRFFSSVTSGQGKLIRESISQNVQLSAYDGEIYSYEEALERYKLALANAVVKRGKASEKAYICLKSAWLLRGYAESQEEQGQTENLKELKAAEEEYLLNAFNGFVEARKSESFPMCGMDESTIDYLLAVLALHLKKLDIAGKLITSILSSSANARTKDKARDLKEQLMVELKNNNAK